MINNFFNIIKVVVINRVVKIFSKEILVIISMIKKLIIKKILNMVGF